MTSPALPNALQSKKKELETSRAAANLNVNVNHMIYIYMHFDENRIYVISSGPISKNLHNKIRYKYIPLVLLLPTGGVTVWVFPPPTASVDLHVWIIRAEFMSWHQHIDVPSVGLKLCQRHFSMQKSGFLEVQSRPHGSTFTTTRARQTCHMIAYVHLQVGPFQVTLFSRHCHHQYFDTTPLPYAAWNWVWNRSTFRLPDVQIIWLHAWCQTCPDHDGTKSSSEFEPRHRCYYLYPLSCPIH